MKTYLFMILGAIASILLGSEIIGAKTYAWIMGLLAAGGGAAIRHAIAKTDAKATIAAQAASEAAAAAHATKAAVTK